MSDCDVVVIGAGHQGLVAANLLAERGLSVVVVEAANRIGGAVASDDPVVPGHVHDLFATNMNLFLGSPYYRDHAERLAAAGLRFVRSAMPYASAFTNGRNLRVSCDEPATREMFHGHDPLDATGWDRLRRVFDDFAAAYLPAYSHPLPSLGALASIRAAWSRRGSTPIPDLAKILLSSTRTLGERYFHSPEARALVAAWGMHLDYAPDITGGAVFPLLECYGDMLGGMSLVEGGAGHLPAAIASLVRSGGGVIRTDARAARITTRGALASGVEFVGGERIGAGLAVLSTAVLPRTVELIADSAVPARMRDAAESYRFGPGTFMLHLVIDGPIPWSDPELGRFAYVHAGGYVDDMARTYQQAMAGQLPDAPLLVVGQTSVVDPSRVPDSSANHLVWIQVRTVPGAIRGDAAGAITDLTWSGAAEPFADRVLALLELYAPGITDRVVGRLTLSPDDLERADANLVGGDSVSGSHHLDQFALLRPSHDLSRYRTPIDGLYLAGAGTWPGAAVNAVSGQLAAEAIIRRHTRRLGRRVRHVMSPAKG